MANEYGELEQLVNDVTSLDTARMTLRWALERLNSIEKERADLKKNLALTEETSKQLQAKLGTLEDSFKSRTKSLSEKEGFYTKLEATMSLLGSGKLDIQQLLKKEARLDQLRRSLEDEYQDKFEQLDRNQRFVIERWNARLLEVESQYAAKLGESQKKYDTLRSDLENDHQGRLLALQKSFSARENELTGRINLLETSVKADEHRLEDRKRELETEFLAKKREVDENYGKLRNMLEQGLEERLRAMDSDHGEQVKRLELSWKAERGRLMEEQRVREEQFASAQDRIKEVENLLASQQESHHGELIKIINEKEAAFRFKLEALEKEKKAYSLTVAKMQEQIGAKESQWAQEREKLNAELSQRISLNDSSVRERAAALEKEYAAKKAELDKVVAAARQEFEEQFQSRLAFERLAMEEEKNRTKNSLLFGEAALKKADEKIKELEAAFSASKSEHHRELMDKLAAGEAAFREKMAQFEEEKQAYSLTIEKLAEELRAKENMLLAEKEQFSKQATDKASAYQAQLSAKEGVFEFERMAFEKKISVLRGEISDKEKALVLERENLSNALAKVSAEAKTMAEKRMAGILAEYEKRKTGLEREFEIKFADRVKALEFEKARAGEAVALKEGQLKGAYEKIKALESGIEALKAEYSNEKAELSKAHEEKLKAQAAEFDIARADYAEESSLKEAALRERLEELSVYVSDKEQALVMERENLSNVLAKVSAEARTMAEERVAGIRAEYEFKKAELEAEYRERGAKADAGIQKLKKEIYKDCGREQEVMEAEKARIESVLKQREREYLEKVKQVDKQKEDLAGKEEELRVKYEEMFHDRVVEHEGDLKVLREGFGKERAQFRAEITAREESVRLMGLELDAVKTGAVQAKAGFEAAFYAAISEAESDKETMRKEFAGRKVKLESGLAEQSRRLEAEYSSRKEELEKKLAERAASWHARQEADYRSREETWKMERSRLMDAAASRDEQVKLAQAKIRAIQGELESRSRALEKAAAEKYASLEREFDNFKATRIRELEESWARQRDAFAKELAARDALVQQISEEMVSLREGLAQSAAQKAQDAEEVIQLRAANGKWREKEERKKDTEKRILALKDEWEHEKAGQILYYQEKMDKLVEACEKYSKELDAREEALRRGEKA